MRPLLAIAVWLVSVVSHMWAAVGAQPNVIVFLADDLGYGDLSCRGSTTIATARLDRLAPDEVRFTDAYSAAPYNSPSRAALRTGRMPSLCGLPYVLSRQCTTACVTPR